MKWAPFSHNLKLEISGTKSMTTRAPPLSESHYIKLLELLECWKTHTNTPLHCDRESTLDSELLPGLLIHW